MLLHVTALSYFVGAGAYVLAMALILASLMRHRYRMLLLAACALTAGWAAVVASMAVISTLSPSLVAAAAILEQSQSALWIAVAVFALFAASGNQVWKRAAVTLVAGVAGAIAYNMAIAFMTLGGLDLPAPLLRGVYFANVLVAISGLLLVENIFRNSSREARWSVKYLCFGLGVAFSYDFFVYAQAALLGQIDGSSYAARGFIRALAMPLIILSAARSKNLLIDMHVSRSVVFHSATLLAAGTYLIIMAAAGYSFRIFDSPWGTVSQASFLTASLLLLAVVLSSGEVHARIKSFISQNFFTYKYDYRVEWVRFIDSISDRAVAEVIPDRVIRSLANIIGSTGGKIWIKQGDDPVFHVAGAWNMESISPDITMSDPWLRAFADCPDVVDLRQDGGKGRDLFKANLPQWLTREPHSLIVLPLVHAENLIGLVVLGEMRAPRPFHWEDLQLLKIAARQAASYIAEESAARALAQVRRFEEFNHRFAFIVHDVKNLAAQMTLILRNADRHAGNPEFQKDVLRTVGESADRLRAMLEQLKDPVGRPSMPGNIDLVNLLHEVAGEWRMQVPNLESDLPAGPLYVVGERDQLRTIVGHLIQNAVDAIGKEGRVGLELHIEGVLRNCGISEDTEKSWAVITVADNGHGMDETFVENVLFQPLSSSKASGFGIGAFQAKQVARDMGGRLDVESKRGQGTRITMRLPYVRAALEADVWDAGAQPRARTHNLRSA